MKKQLHIKWEQSPSKQEEIDTMRDIADYARDGRDTYLRSLFTPEFLQWVETKIRNDIGPDIMDYMEAVNRINNIMENKIEHMKGNAEQLQNNFNMKENEVSSLRELLSKMVHESDKDTKIWRDEKNDFIHQIAGIETVMDAQSHTIMELKAKLYDLMKGGEMKL